MTLPPCRAEAGLWAKPAPRARPMDDRYWSRSALSV